jgi:hypothetical protein
MMWWLPTGNPGGSETTALKVPLFVTISVPRSIGFE